MSLSKTLKENDSSLKDIYTFKEGIYGFEQLKKFVFVNQGNKENIFRLMISIDKPEIGFIVVPPTFVYKNYEIEICDTELENIGVKSEHDLFVLCIVTLSKDNTRIFVNLKSPLVFSSSAKSGKQVILDNSPYKIRHMISIKN